MSTPGGFALSGHSMGGYSAPRAAAYEKQIKAVIANSLTPEFKPVLMAGLGLDPNAPYGDDIGDKIDLSEPMKKYMATNLLAAIGFGRRVDPCIVRRARPLQLAELEGKFTCLCCT